MTEPTYLLDRRQFLTSTAAAGAGLMSCTLAQAESNAAANAADVAFFLVSDTHFLANKEQPNVLDEKSIATCRSLVDTLNKLPGTAIPLEAGGGIVAQPRGVIHGGDLIDSGDKNGGPHPRMVETEWAGFVDEYGLTGKDGRLKYPVYEVHGNHDSPPGNGLPVQKIIERNMSRPGLKNVSDNGVHYSWDWGPVHFVNLGIVVGSDPQLKRPGRYNPLESYSFLKTDLERNVGSTGRPVVITHHVDVARYSKPCDEQAKAAGGEWDFCDVRAYHRLLKPYNIMAILYGHTHVRQVYRWNGTPDRVEDGIPVFNVDNGSHFSSNDQAFFYFHLKDDTLTLREVQTKDRWQSFAFTPQVWSQKVKLGRG
ncbi:MAG: metallophosphoesterase [Planctomycetota bacterium]